MNRLEWTSEMERHQFPGSQDGQGGVFEEQSGGRTPLPRDGQTMDPDPVMDLEGRFSEGEKRFRNIETDDIDPEPGLDEGFGFTPDADVVGIEAMHQHADTAFGMFIHVGDHQGRASSHFQSGI
jgi:hypothetical protein